MHSNVSHTDEISDHDMSYAISNVKKKQYEQRYVIKKPKRSMEHSKSYIKKAADSYKTTLEWS